MAEKGGMFKDVMQAVEKLKALCAKPGTGYVDGIPLVDTEVFNEGWMLRLVVSALAEAPFLKKDGYRSSKIKEAIATIRRLSKKGWCSEGQLSPAHKNEGPTCADGLVGDIAISPTRSGKRKKWGFDGASGELCALEAKLGSMLAKGTTHSSKYNQVARYLSCLAKIELSKGCDLASCLYVIGPRIEKLEKQTDEYLEQDNLREAVKEMQLRDEIIRQEKLLGRKWSSVIDGIAMRSMYISWDDIIDALPEDYKKDVQSFYKDAKIANRVNDKK